MPTATDRAPKAACFVPGFSLAIALLFTALYCFPRPVLAGEDSPEVNELKQSAQKAHIAGNYQEAVDSYLEIATRHSHSAARRNAVQMLGTLYEDNLTDLKKAIRWDREYLKKYADPRQVPFYKEKLERLTALEKKANQESAFKEYQSIKFANKGDQVQVKRLEALVQKYPGFELKADAQREIAYAYARLNKPKQSYAAFQAISSQNPGKKLSTSDRIIAETNHRYWEMAVVWGWVAGCAIALLWGVVLAMRPWRRITRRTVWSFLIMALLYALLTAMRMPTFYALETTGYRLIVKDTAVFALAGLNLSVLLWIVLLSRGEFWLTRPRLLRWLSVPLSLLMTAAVFYLFVVTQPNGPEITDVFGVKYQYILGEIRERI